MEHIKFILSFFRFSSWPTARWKESPQLFDPRCWEAKIYVFLLFYIFLNQLFYAHQN